MSNCFIELSDESEDFLVLSMLSRTSVLTSVLLSTATLPPLESRSSTATLVSTATLPPATLLLGVNTGMDSSDELDKWRMRSRFMPLIVKKHIFHTYNIRKHFERSGTV